MTDILVILASISIVSIIYSLFNYNPMYSLLFFILSLFNIVIFLFLQNYEFLALLLGLIYFGAILILFFFILLLINVQVVTRDNLHIKKIPLISIPLLFSFYLFIYNSKVLGLYAGALKTNLMLEFSPMLSLETLSFNLFTNFSTHILILGLILFLVLIGLVLILVNNKTLNLNFLRKSI